jgi:para-aminobenzoate synthetase / 4-amino-4-deoxychorismate lyase
MSASIQPVTLQRVPLDCRLSPRDALRAISDRPWPFALTGSWAGGGAVVGSDPLLIADAGADPFSTLDALPELRDDTRDGELAVGGGWFGWLGYRLGARIESLPAGPPRPVPLPDFHLAYYDHVLHLDRSGQWWFEALVGAGGEGRIARRLQEIRFLLANRRPRERYVAPEPFRLGATGREDHLAAVRECRERIVAGEIYQANICLRLQTRWDGSVMELLAQALDRIDPPFAAAFQTPEGGIASLSPELFLRRVNGAVTTAPIKGTIQRSHDPRRAQEAVDRLRGSTKDAAEHVMIVDLMRNDLGRVCAYGTIEADRMPEAEPHPGVWHLVSRVRGQLRPGVGNGDLLRASFPPGSVTGAPKVQAMRVISELESTGREVYTGAIGFASPVAGLELSVAIRTFELGDGVLWVGAGGGIVADSDPEREFDEALAKARPLTRAIGSDLAPTKTDPRPVTRPRVATAGGA